MEASCITYRNAMHRQLRSAVVARHSTAPMLKLRRKRNEVGTSTIHETTSTSAGRCGNPRSRNRRYALALAKTPSTHLETAPPSFVNYNNLPKRAHVAITGSSCDCAGLLDPSSKDDSARLHDFPACRTTRGSAGRRIPKSCPSGCNQLVGAKGDIYVAPFCSSETDQPDELAGTIRVAARHSTDVGDTTSITFKSTAGGRYYSKDTPASGRTNQRAWCFGPISATAKSDARRSRIALK
jgi:hypothetical protein